MILDFGFLMLIEGIEDLCELGVTAVKYLCRPDMASWLFLTKAPVYARIGLGWAPESGEVEGGDLEQNRKNKKLQAPSV